MREKKIKMNKREMRVGKEKATSERDQKKAENRTEKKLVVL